MASSFRPRLSRAEAARLLRAEGSYSGVRDDLTRRMERVLEKAKSDAPVLTGNYRDGLQIRQDTTDRAVVRVVGTAPHSHLVEAQSGNLARALDEADGA